MSMVINLVEDHNIYLCEGGPVYNGGVQPTPIYLTQWKIVGNSQVHGVGNLTSWKVSGNSIVQDGVIMSCGDLGQDGKYHVKISNGVDVFDIALNEPLRKVNDIADTIEFVNGVATITRNIKSAKWSDLNIIYQEENVRFATPTAVKDIFQPTSSSMRLTICLSGDFVQNNAALNKTGLDMCMVVYDNLRLYIKDYSINTPSAFQNKYGNHELLYRLATPTTELVDAPQIAVSPTNTYTSANVVSFSAFEHTEDKEIWSCGEYNPTDGKYHILVQPQGGSIADIALDAPLRKVNDVADTIEFPSDTDGKALVTRPLKSINLYEHINSISRKSTYKTSTDSIYAYQITILSDVLPPPTNDTLINGLCSAYIVGTRNDTYRPNKTCIAVSDVKNCYIYDSSFNGADDIDAFKAHITEAKPEFIYELATPTTELVDAPQIQEAESYSMVIGQGGKAVEWSSFETE